MEGMDQLSGLVDVKISEHGEEDILMAIETISQRDIILSVFLFIGVIASTTCAGVFGPPAMQTETTKYTLSRETTNVVRHIIPGVKPENQFLSMKLGFELSNPMEAQFTSHVAFSYFIVFYSGGLEVRREQGSFSENIVFEPRSETSEFIAFFFDRFLNYDRVDLRIDFREFEKVTDAVISWQTGEPRHIGFELWMRSLFVVCISAASILLYMRLKRISRNSWTLEMKATLILGVFAVIGGNPLFPLYTYKPSLFYELINEFFLKIFTAAVLVYMLVVVDHVRLGKTSKVMFIPKFVLFLAMFFADFIPVIIMPFGMEIAAHVAVVAVKYSRIVLRVIYIAWIVYIWISAVRQLDSVETFKLVVYAVAFTIVILINLSEFIGPAIPLLNNTFGMFSMQLSSLETFVLLMVFCHWPYEYDVDEIYDEQQSDGDDPKGLMDSESN